MYRHILVPTDGSKQSENAIHNAVRFAKTFNARVTGFHAVPSALMPNFGDSAIIVPSMIEEFDAAAKQKAAEYLAVLEREATAEGVPCETVTVTSNIPYEAIIKTAEENGCDLIVMASHGRKGMEGLLVGSETMKVLTHSRIPVLVYR